MLTAAVGGGGKADWCVSLVPAGQSHQEHRGGRTRLQLDGPAGHHTALQHCYPQPQPQCHAPFPLHVDVRTPLSYRPGAAPWSIWAGFERWWSFPFSPYLHCSRWLTDDFRQPERLFQRDGLWTLRFDAEWLVMNATLTLTNAILTLIAAILRYKRAMLPGSGRR